MDFLGRYTKRINDIELATLNPQAQDFAKLKSHVKEITEKNNSRGQEKKKLIKQYNGLLIC